MLCFNILKKSFGDIFGDNNLLIRWLSKKGVSLYTFGSVLHFDIIPWDFRNFKLFEGSLNFFGGLLLI